MSFGHVLRNPATATLVLAGFLLFLAGKLVWVQGVRADAIAADVDRIVEKHVRVEGPRGQIFDARGRLLAGNRASVNLVADARELDKAEARGAARALRGREKPGTPEWDRALFAERVDRRARLVSDLARALDHSIGAKRRDPAARARDLVERLSRLHRDRKTGEVERATYVPIAKELTPEDEAETRAVLRAHGVSSAFQFEEEYDRIYPAGAAVASVVGFYGAKDQKENAKKTAPAARAADQPQRIGQGGIEGSFERDLRGRNGIDELQRAPLAPGGFLDLEDEVEPVPGADVHLTIDATLCAILEEEAKAAYQQYPCDAVAAVTLDAETGRILAMASVPCFDPNAPPEAKNFPLTSHATGFSYEPGSSIKPFTVAAALESGALDPHDSFDVNYPGGYPVPKRAKPIRDAHTYPGSLDVRGILQRSSNIGAVKIGHRAGPRVLAAAFERFGFDSKTRLPLSGIGRVWIPDRAREWDVANTLTSVAFGYQFYVTPLRLAAGYAMLANGGTRVEPRLVEQVRRPDGSVAVPESPAGERVLSPATAGTVCELLTSVVREEGGTAYTKARQLAKQGYPEVDLFAGKTGTAVIHKDPARMNGTFAVFGPMPEPRVVTVFVVFNSGARYGGDQVAGPAMRSLARTLRAVGLVPWGPRSVRLESQGIPAVVAEAAAPRNESNPNPEETR